MGASIHNVTFSTAGVSGSGDKTSGGSFQKAFPNAGVFNYQCTNHPGMTGKVTVQ
jgi:plastocyanin